MAGQGIALMWDGLDAPYLQRKWLIELGKLRIQTKNTYHLSFPKNSPYEQRISQAIA